MAFPKDVSRYSTVCVSDCSPSSDTANCKINLHWLLIEMDRSIWQTLFSRLLVLFCFLYVVCLLQCSKMGSLHHSTLTFKNISRMTLIAFCNELNCDFAKIRKTKYNKCLQFIQQNQLCQYIGPILFMTFELQILEPN